VTPFFPILAGPTASGKSAVAQFLALKHGAEILSVDSMKLYCGLDVGTGKPTPREQAGVRHHWIDVRDPWESSSVAEFMAFTEPMVAQTCSQFGSGKIALLGEGGTALYLKTLAEGLFDGPGKDDAVRTRLEEEAKVVGPEELYRRLTPLDPIVAARIMPSDTRRIVRALEVYEITGKPLGSMQTQWGTARTDLDIRIACLTLPRERLYARIDRRIFWMLEHGWVEEARALRALPQPLSQQASLALGYKTLFKHLDGEMTFAAARERICFDTHHFARRQLNWFRHLPKRTFIELDESESVENLARRVEAAWGL
jgi:tRNA dimethylallyltransferase